MHFDKSRREATKAVQVGDYGGQAACLCKTYTMFLLGPQCCHADLTCALYISPHFFMCYFLYSSQQLHSIKPITQILKKTLRLILKQSTCKLNWLLFTRCVL